jgi:hypothetical protein
VCFTVVCGVLGSWDETIPPLVLSHPSHPDDQWRAFRAQLIFTQVAAAVRSTTGDPLGLWGPIGTKSWTGGAACGDLASRLRGTISVEQAMCGCPLLQCSTQPGRRRSIASAAGIVPICMRPACDAAMQPPGARTQSVNTPVLSSTLHATVSQAKGVLHLHNLAISTLRGCLDHDMPSAVQIGWRSATRPGPACRISGRMRIALAGSPYPWLPQQIVGARQGFQGSVCCNPPM